MVNITGTSSIRYMPPQDGPTLDDISDKFKRGGEDQHIRFSEAKGLHTHSKYGSSTMDFLAFFRNPDALRQRGEMRAQGAQVVSDAIDREFGPGMGERVFARMNIAPGQGVTLGQVHQMKEVASQILQQDLDQARDKVGAMDIYQFFSECHVGLNMGSAGRVYEHYSVAELEGVLGRMAQAINSSGGTTAEECTRVGTGEIISYNLLKKNTEGGNAYSEAQIEQFNDLMRSCFEPGGANAGFKPHLVFLVMSGHCERGTLPTPEQLTESLTMRSMVA